MSVEVCLNVGGKIVRKFLKVYFISRVVKCLCERDSWRWSWSLVRYFLKHRQHREILLQSIHGGLYGGGLAKYVREVPTKCEHFRCTVIPLASSNNNRIERYVEESASTRSVLRINETVPRALSRRKYRSTVSKKLKGKSSSKIPKYYSRPQSIADRCEM